MYLKGSQNNSFCGIVFCVVPSAYVAICYKNCLWKLLITIFKLNHAKLFTGIPGKNINRTSCSYPKHCFYLRHFGSQKIYHWTYGWSVTNSNIFIICISPLYMCCWSEHCISPLYIKFMLSYILCFQSSVEQWGELKGKKNGKKFFFKKKTSKTRKQIKINSKSTRY